MTTAGFWHFLPQRWSHLPNCLNIFLPSPLGSLFSNLCIGIFLMSLLVKCCKHFWKENRWEITFEICLSPIFACLSFKQVMSLTFRHFQMCAATKMLFRMTTVRLFKCGHRSIRCRNNSTSIMLNPRWISQNNSFLFSGELVARAMHYLQNFQKLSASYHQHCDMSWSSSALQTLFHFMKCNQLENQDANTDHHQHTIQLTPER